LKTKINNKVELSDLNDAKKFFDMKFNWNKNNKFLFLFQPKYNQELLNKFKIIDEKSMNSSTI
jgi:hypothetical protein